MYIEYWFNRPVPQKKYKIRDLVPLIVACRSKTQGEGSGSQQNWFLSAWQPRTAIVDDLACTWSLCVPEKVERKVRIVKRRLTWKLLTALWKKLCGKKYITVNTEPSTVNMYLYSRLSSIPFFWLLKKSLVLSLRISTTTKIFKENSKYRTFLQVNFLFVMICSTSRKFILKLWLSAWWGKKPKMYTSTKADVDAARRTFYWMSSCSGRSGSVYPGWNI